MKLRVLKDYLANENAADQSTKRRRLGSVQESELGLEYIEMSVPLPQIISSEEEKDEIESASDTANKILFAQLIGPLILQLFLRGVMKSIWPLYMTL